MSTITTKVKNAIREPHQIPRFLRRSLRTTIELASSGRWGPLYGLFTAGVTGHNRYIENRLDLNDDGFVERTIQGNRMLLDPSDRGLAHDLITYGSRERTANAVYRTELSRLRTDVDGTITVLEIGANIGYYALQAADILGDRAQIYAFEPSERNVNLLSRNIDLNNYDAIEIIHGGVGDQQTTAQLHVAEHSNLHTIDTGDEQELYNEEVYTDTVDVPMYTVDGFLEERDIPSETIRVVRMDVEGYEVNVFAGMQSVLEADAPLLLFVELHPHRTGVEPINEILESLETNDFEIVSVTASLHKEPYEYELDVQSFDDLYDLERAVRLVVRR